MRKKLIIFNDAADTHRDIIFCRSGPDGHDLVLAERWLHSTRNAPEAVKIEDAPKQLDALSELLCIHGCVENRIRPGSR